MPLFNYAYYSTIALKWDKGPAQTREQSSSGMPLITKYVHPREEF